MKKKFTFFILLFFIYAPFTLCWQESKNTISIKNTEDNYLGFDVDYKGKIKVSDDDRSVISISPNGFLKISKSAFGNSRTILIESDANGKLTKKMYNGRNQESFEPNGKMWLEEIFPGILRTSEIAVEQRVKRIYAQKGMKGFLYELSLIDESFETSENIGGFIKYEIHYDSDNKVKNCYLSSLIMDVSLTSSDLNLIIPEIAKVKSNSTKGSLLREILYQYKLSNTNIVSLFKATGTLEYNTERGSILRVTNPILPMDSVVLDAYFLVIKKMEINSEKGNVLKDLVKQNTLSGVAIIKLLESIDSFSSEREKGAIMLTMLPYIPNDKQVHDKFIEVVNNIDDNYYVLKGEILKTYVRYQTNPDQKEERSKQMCLLLLKGSDDLISNSQRGENLRQVNRIFVNDAVVMTNYISILKGLTNNLESYNVVLDLVNNNKLDKFAQIQVLKFVKRLIYDDYQHAAGAILRELLKQLVTDQEVIITYLDVISNMDQNSTIEELMRLTIIDKKILQYKVAFIKIIEIAENISVDIETSLILLRIQPYLTNTNEELIYIYQSVADDMESQYWKNKTLEGFNIL